MLTEVTPEQIDHETGESSVRDAAFEFAVQMSGELSVQRKRKRHI